jgi:ABC-type sugar transport system permease subunit
MTYYDHRLCTLVKQVADAGGKDQAWQRVSGARERRWKKGLDIGGSAAQSVILMLIVVALTVLQVRYVERRVQYQ